MVPIGKQPRVWTGTQWDTLAVTLPDLSNYSTTTQMNTAISTGAGLNLISTTSLSSSASCIFTNLSAGGRYRIVGRVIGTTTAQGLLYYWREGSTNKTANYAAYQYGTLNGTSGFYEASTTYGVLSTIGTQATNKVSFFSADIYIHTDRTAAYINGQGTGADSSATNSPRHIAFGGFNISMSACDGFTIVGQSGNLTGSISLYQYKD